MKNLYIVAASLIGSIAFAQNGVVSGKIVDGTNQFSLPGATLKIENSNKYTISDQHGNYEFLNLPEGTYTVQIDYIGYVSTSQEITIVPNQNTTTNFEMYAESEELDEIVIIGDFLRGQAKALNQQKNNVNISNIISSDQVGRFPDANIGDALKRVSGVTMQNDQGEARNIIIRGLSPELNSVSLNGDRIPSAEGDNRNVQMDLIPSDMISSIEVNKTLTSDMDADAIGGSVNLITRAVPNRERISATVSGGYAPIRDKGLYNGAFVYGNRFADNKLGMIASATWQSQNFGSDNIESVWDKDANGNAFVSEMDIRKYDVQRVRRSFSLSSDYVFNENHRLDFTAMYNWRDDRENRYRTRYRDMELQDDGTYLGEIRRETKGGIDNKRNKNTRLEDQRVINFSLRGEHLLTPKLDMDWAVSYSKASEDRPNERYIDFNQKDVVLEQNTLNSALPTVSAVDGEHPENFELRKITENHDYTQEEEIGARLNFRVPLSIIEDQKGRLRFGARLRLKDKVRDNIFYEYEPINPFGHLGTLPNSHFGGNGYNPGSQYAPGTFVHNGYLGGLNLGDASQFESSLQPSEFLSSNYKAKEQITAAYVRWDQDFSNRTSLIAGLRVEHTAINYTGNYIMNEEDLVGSIEHKNDYTNVLPSVTLKHKFDDNFILRAAVTTSLARPNYYNLAPFVNVIQEDSEIAAGNPNLKATYATNFDVMVENYFENIGIVSGGVFYKNLDNFIYTYNNNIYTSNDFSAEFPTVANPIPAGENWNFTQARNGDKVSVYGFEVAFQRQLDFLPGKFFKNFGLYTNYTFTQSKAKGITSEDGSVRDGLGLPRTAPHMFNGSLAWENSKFSARLSTNYTSKYLDEIGGNEFEDSYYDQQFFLDFNMAYKFTPNWRVFFEANNLTNQPLRYYQGDSNRLKQLEYYQSRVTLGIKYDF